MMSNLDEARWMQRLESFENALSQLTDACAITEYSDLERAGLVQTFEFSFEFAWNTLKDLLFFEGYDEKVPRSIIRKGFEAGYLGEDDSEALLDALDKRNLLSHTYRKEFALEAEALIKNSYHPALLQLHATLNERRRR